MYKASAYVNHNQTRPWTSDDGGDGSKVKKTQIKPSLKKIDIHPVFELLALKCEELGRVTWYDLFHRASTTGKFPSGFSFKDNKLYFKHRKTTKFIEITGTDDDSVLEYMRFIENNIGGIGEKAVVCENPDPTDDTCDLMADIRKKTRLRDMLACRYIHENVKSQYNLTSEQERSLVYVTIMHTMTSNFSNDDITVEGNAIVAIRGIDFDYFARTGEWRYLPPDAKKAKKGSSRKRCATPAVPSD
jgi:hypothetical protein